MLPQPPAVPQSRRLGVGIDTARYGHYACFLNDDLQPAAPELAFAESGAGYAQLHQRLLDLVQRHGAVHFVVRLDAAGQYADNLRHFLHGLPQPADAGCSPTFTQASRRYWTSDGGRVRRQEQNRRYRLRRRDPVS